VPTPIPIACKLRWNGYGRRRVCASTPEVGAQCGSSARWDLCGGRRVTGVPTAKDNDDACDDVMYYIAGDAGLDGVNDIGFLNRYEKTGWSCGGWWQHDEIVYAYRRIANPVEGL
jgi:hypothetical protein